MRSLARANLLVIDDSRPVRQIVRAVLQGCVGSVREAEDPYLALEQWPRLAPDVVVVDYQMPRMDGVTFTRVVRDFERPGRRRTTIVMMTGNGALSVVRATRHAGVDGFLAKPVTVGALLHRVQRAFSQAPVVAPGPTHAEARAG